MSNKIKFNDFIKDLDWNSKDRAYWKEIFKKADSNYWEEGPYCIIDESYSRLLKENDTVKDSQFVPFVNADGVNCLSKARKLQDHIRRIRYVKRGNTIHTYDKEKKYQEKYYRVDESAWHVAVNPFILKETEVDDIHSEIKR